MESIYIKLGFNRRIIIYPDKDYRRIKITSILTEKIFATKHDREYNEMIANHIDSYILSPLPETESTLLRLYFNLMRLFCYFLTYLINLIELIILFFPIMIMCLRPIGFIASKLLLG
jgi:hypothetical protein